MLEIVSGILIKYSGSEQVIRVPDGVTAIGREAFAYTDITYVSIPASVKRIYDGAFRDCKKLREVEVLGHLNNVGNCAFYNCTELQSFTGSVENLGDSVFENCISLKAVNIYKLRYTGERVFKGCKNLGEFHFEGSIKEISVGTFCNCSSLGVAELPTEINYIENEAFQGCTGLKSILIPDSVVSIGNYAFDGCESIEHIHIPANVDNIGFKAFRGCKSLTQITVAEENDKYNTEDGVLFSRFKAESDNNGIQEIKSLILYPACSERRTYTVPADIKYIGESAFDCCKKLERIKINSDTFVANGAFAGCSNLTYIDGIFDASFISSGAFVGCDRFDIYGELIAKFGAGIYDRDKIKGVSIPDGVTEIIMGAFEDCQNLETVTIPDSVEYIGKRAFHNCINLRRVWLPFVRDIEEMVFCGCERLRCVVMSICTKNIKQLAFAGCKSLESIVLPPSLEHIDTCAFFDSGLTKIEIPHGIDVIEVGTFANCVNLKAVYMDMADSLYMIKKSAFSGCKRLDYIEIPDSVHTIETCAFHKSGIEDIIVGKGIRKVSRGAFDRTPIYDNQVGDFVIVGNILLRYRGRGKEVYIPDGVECIASEAFYCTDVENVIIPESVVAVGDHIFRGCKHLKNIDIRGTLKSIGESAFETE